MRACKYKLGDLINDREVIEIKNGRYYVRCFICGKIAIGRMNNLEKRFCLCKKIISNRYSGKTYVNSKEKLEQIKNKYKNGIPMGEIERWINGS